VAQLTGILEKMRKNACFVSQSGQKNAADLMRTRRSDRKV
jgi:hypothetical protein